jgi:pantoate--beta-alanine ligase
MSAKSRVPDTPETAQRTPLPTVRRIAEVRAAVADWRRAGHSVALVPTMGGLHDGHVALIRQARAECDRTVASLFVNPIQFNDAEDLRAYPRDEAGDAAMFAAAGTDLLFAPPAEEIYPAGFATQVRVAGLGDCLCAAARPGHMEGVATVVAKLLNQARPDVAYFGEKDFQQLQIIRRMAADLDLDVRIAGVPTMREADGLALSSRNVLLSLAERRAAPALHRALAAAAADLAGGAGAAGPAIETARRAILAAGFRAIDYLELRAEADLAALVRADRPARLFAAAWLGKVRLIDNVAVESGGS